MADVVDILNRLQAGVIYCPQHFPSQISSIAFSPRESDDRLVSAIEGLDLAMAIADDLSLNYSIYSHDQATIRGIRVAAFQSLQRGRSATIERRWPNRFR